MFRRKERLSVGWRPGEGWRPKPGQNRSIEIFLWDLERFEEAVKACDQCQLKNENCSGLRATFVADELKDASALFTNELVNDYQFRRLERLVRKNGQCRPIVW